MIRASEPPMKHRRFSYGLVHTDFMTSALLFDTGLPIRSHIAADGHHGMINIMLDDKVNMAVKPLTSAQMRAARALIRWSAEDLARETALSVTTIRRAELM